jgi:DNA polymerase-3 subunit beta
MLPAASFTEAVRRVSLAADRTSPVRLTFSPGSVLVEAHSEGRAQARESVPADFEGGEQVISFSPQLLLDGLIAAGAAADSSTAGQGADGPLQIRIEFSTSARPALITWAGDEGVQDGQPAFRYLVAPLRVPGRE